MTFLRPVDGFDHNNIIWDLVSIYFVTTAKNKKLKFFNNFVFLPLSLIHPGFQ